MKAFAQTKTGKGRKSRGGQSSETRSSRDKDSKALMFRPGSLAIITRII